MRRFFCLRPDFCVRHLFLRQKFAEDKKSKNGNYAEDNKIRLGIDFSLDHTGGWGVVSNTMITIGNFRDIKGLT